MLQKSNPSGIHTDDLFVESSPEPDLFVESSLKPAPVGVVDHSNERTFLEFFSTYNNQAPPPLRGNKYTLTREKKRFSSSLICKKKCLNVWWFVLLSLSPHSGQEVDLIIHMCIIFMPRLVFGL